MNKSKLPYLILVLLNVTIISFFGNVANAQIWNSNGGYTTSYGMKYNTMGLAFANQIMYNNMLLQESKRLAREDMLRQFGPAEVERLEREGKASWLPYSKTNDPKISSTPESVAAPALVEKMHGIFQPDNSADAKLLADKFFNAENEFLKPLFLQTIAKYEKNIKPAWKNNVAGAITVFTMIATLIYHDVELPKDFAEDDYFNSVNNTLNHMPNNASDKEKQTLYNVLIGFSGLLEKDYDDAKQRNDAQELINSRKLAGELMEKFLGINPNNIYFENNIIVIKNAN